MLRTWKDGHIRQSDNLKSQKKQVLEHKIRASYTGKTRRIHAGITGAVGNDITWVSQCVDGLKYQADFRDGDGIGMERLRSTRF